MPNQLHKDMLRVSYTEMKSHYRTLKLISAMREHVSLSETIREAVELYLDVFDADKSYRRAGESVVKKHESSTPESVEAERREAFLALARKLSGDSPSSEN